MLHGFNEEFQREKHNCLNHKGWIIQHLVTHETKAKFSLDACDDKILELYQILQNNNGGRIDADSNFQSLLKKNLDLQVIGWRVQPLKGRWQVQCYYVWQ